MAFNVNEAAFAGDVCTTAVRELFSPSVSLPKTPGALILSVVSSFTLETSAAAFGGVFGVGVGDGVGVIVGVGVAVGVGVGVIVGVGVGVAVGVGVGVEFESPITKR